MTSNRASGRYVDGARVVVSIIAMAAAASCQEIPLVSVCELALRRSELMGKQISVRGEFWSTREEMGLASPACAGYPRKGEVIVILKLLPNSSHPQHEIESAKQFFEFFNSSPRRRANKVVVTVKGDFRDFPERGRMAGLPAEMTDSQPGSPGSLGILDARLYSDWVQLSR